MVLSQKYDLADGHINIETTWQIYWDRRARIQNGGLFSGGYSALLTATLRMVDRFFGDDPETQPTWTSRSVGHTLFLSLAFPIAILVVLYIYAEVTGPVGQFLEFLEIRSATHLLIILGSAAALVASMSWLGRPLLSPGRTYYLIERFAAFAVAVVAVMLAVSVAFGLAFTGAGALAMAAAVALTVAAVASGARAFEIAIVATFTATVGVAGAGDSVLALIFLIAIIVFSSVATAAAVVGAWAVVLAVLAVFMSSLIINAAILGSEGPLALFAEFAFYFAFAVVISLAVALAVILMNERCPGWGWAIYFVIALAAPLLLAARPSVENSWPELMAGALPVINALFAWFSLGLTRKLLRDGMRRQGIWPFVNAAVDVVAAITLLFGLLVVCLAYVHAMNIACAAAGSPLVFDVAATLDLLRNDPGNTSLWWIYITIFTTFIPSLVNLVLGGLAIVRGLPYVNAWIVEQFLPRDPTDLTIARRFGASVCLSGQLTVAVVGAGFVAWLAFVVVFQGLGAVGLGLVDVAETVNGWLSALFPGAAKPKPQAPRVAKPLASVGEYAKPRAVRLRVAC